MACSLRVSVVAHHPAAPSALFHGRVDQSQIGRAPGRHCVAVCVTVSELLTHQDVAAFLGVKLRVLTWWLYAFRESRRYTTFEISRRSGEGTRTN